MSDSGDSFTETSHSGFGSRLIGSIKGIVVGLVLMVGSGGFLFWNEGRAVGRAKDLAEGAHDVVSIDAAKVDPAMQGKLVHLSGKATTNDTVADPDFGISVPGALKLKRTVEMYQWKEKKETKKRKKVGGGQETNVTYSYEKTWTEDTINSRSFRNSSGHTNPEAKPFPSSTKVAELIQIGALGLSTALKQEIMNYEPLDATSDTLAGATEVVRSKVRAAGDGRQFYVGKDPASPQIGDARISFNVARPAEMSVIAKQSGAELVPYTAHSGRSLHDVEMGTLSAQAMFTKLESANARTTWIFRLVGFVVMWIGSAMIFGPLARIADVLPFIGNVVEAGVAIITGLISAIITLIIVALAWLVYRPVLGVALLVGAVILFIGMRSRAKSRSGVHAPAFATASPASVGVMSSAGAMPPPPPPPPAVPPPPPPSISA